MNLAASKAMDAYHGAFAIEMDVNGQRLGLARELLTSGSGVVLLENTLALRPDGHRLLCEVITRLPPTAWNADAFRAELETARDLLAESTLRDSVESREQVWIVVENGGMGTVQLWPALT